MKKKELLRKIEELENRILILEAASSYHYYRYPPIYSCQPTITGDRTGTSSDSLMGNSISGEEVYFTLT